MDAIYQHLHCWEQLRARRKNQEVCHQFWKARLKLKEQLQIHNFIKDAPKSKITHSAKTNHRRRHHSRGGSSVPKHFQYHSVRCA